MNLILCGLQKSGKTTVGLLLAQAVGWTFIDTDQLMERSHGMTCREVYLSFGAEKFRELEREAIASLKGIKKCVLATGGGSLTHPENRSTLAKIGTLIYLSADPTRLWKRIDLTPAYLDPQHPEHSFLKVAKNRIPLFQAAAHYTVETDRLTPEEIVDMIIHEVNGGHHG